MTDVIKEEVEQVAEVLTKSMGAGKWIKDFVKSKNPRFAGKSEEKRKEMALGAFYSKEEVEQVVVESTNIKNVSGLKKVSSHGDFDLYKGKGDNHLLVHRETGEVHHGFSGKTLDVKKFLKNYEFENLPRPAKEEVEAVDEGMFSPPKMITGKAAKNRRDYLRDYHPRLIAAKKAAGSSKDYDYEPQRDSETNGTKPTQHKNPYSDSKPKKLTLMSFTAGLKRAAERAKSKTNEEVSLDEGRGRPPKPGSAAWKKRQSEGGGDSDTPGLHGQLIKHKSLQNAPPKIKFTNGEEAHISAEHRDRAIKHLEGMIGPGKNPEARDAAVREMSHSHAGFKQAIGVESKPEEKKSSMSAQRDKPKLSLTKEESNMSQEDIVEKLQAALDAGILSQNDFDKLTQIDELSSNLLNRAKETTYAKLDKTDVNIYPTPNQLKKVQDLRKQGQKFKDAANAKTQSEEVEPIDELSTKTLKSYINKNIKSGRAKEKDGKGDVGLSTATDKVAQRLTTPTLDKKVRKLGYTRFPDHKNPYEYGASRSALADRGIHYFAGRRTVEEVEAVDELANHPYPGPGSKPEKNNPTPPPSRPRADGRPAVKKFPPGHPFAGRPVDSVDFKKSVKEDSEQLAEGPSHLGYSGTVGKKEYTMTIPNKGDGLGDYSDERLHKLITKQNPHLEHHEVSAIVNSGGEEESEQTVVHKGKTHTHNVVNYQEPRHLYNEVNYTGNPIDEKALSPKQKKIAAVAGDPGKIDAEDFKKLRKEETTAGVAAVVAALSRNLKETDNYKGYLEFNRQRELKNYHVKMMRKHKPGTPEHEHHKDSALAAQNSYNKNFYNLWNSI